MSTEGYCEIFESGIIHLVPPSTFYRAVRIELMSSMIQWIYRVSTLPLPPFSPPRVPSNCYPIILQPTPYDQVLLSWYARSLCGPRIYCLSHQRYGRCHKISACAWGLFVKIMHYPIHGTVKLELTSLYQSNTIETTRKWMYNRVIYKYYKKSKKQNLSHQIFKFKQKFYCASCPWCISMRRTLDTWTAPLVSILLTMQILLTLNTWAPIFVVCTLIPDVLIWAHSKPPIWEIQIISFELHYTHYII